MICDRSGLVFSAVALFLDDNKETVERLEITYPEERCDWVEKH
ncbi:hypothetical protein BDK88_1692 [Natrinema hispanicum]|uniref:Uncharacterized protein n=1 Tax=Natrinema hispanicum TaxID=392421 RepID=A0A482Y6Q0_9EURY|nr:hypothetical protein BDK88_1692 [Natrinema hispanicum]